MTTTPGDAAQLAVAVLDAEAEREAQQAAAQEEVLFATDLLPGVGEDEVSLGQAVRIGGVSTFVVLLLLRSLEELESATLSVLAPDLRHTFGVSDGTIVFLAAASGAFLVLGALPMGWLADRYRRPPVIGWANLAFAGFLTLCGAVTNAFQLFWARLGVGIAKSNSIPVQGSMIGDAYPISARGRINAWLAMGSRLVGVLSPVIVAGIAAGRRRRRRVAVAVPAARHPGRGGRSVRVPAAGAAPRSVREAGRARRGHRGRAAGADLDRGRVRPALADPHAQDRHRRVLGHRLRSLHRCRC